MIRRQKRRRTKFSKRVVVGLLIAVAAFTIAVLGIIKYSDNRYVPGEEKDTDEEMKG